MIVGLTTCVGFDDLLAITLPENAQHFDRYLVVTSPTDKGTMAVAGRSGRENVELVVTNAFHRHGEPFNKGAAIAEVAAGLDGWICHIDADTILPQDADFGALNAEYIYSAFRRLLRNPADYHPGLDWSGLPEGPERRNGEFAGYVQLWHTAAGHTYPTGWTHAGGSDSFFYKKFAPECRRRLPFEVLHLGEDGQNWCGRATRRLDGTMPKEARERAQRLAELRITRAQTQSYLHEILPGHDPST